MKNVCQKCGHELKDKSIYCTNCGTKQEIVKKEEIKEETNEVKTKKSHGFLKFLLALILFFLGFALALYLIKNYDLLNLSNNNQNDGIIYSNKNVTVDDTGIADAVEKVIKLKQLPKAYASIFPITLR